MAAVLFSYRSKKEEAKIEVRLSFKKLNKYTSIRARTEIKVSKVFWEEMEKGKRFRDIDKMRERDRIEKALSEIRVFLEDRLPLNDDDIDPQWLKRNVNFYYNPEPITDLPNGLLDYFDFFLKGKKREVKPATFRKWKVIRNKLERFEKDLMRKHSLNEVDFLFVANWQQWNLEQKYDPETINRNFKDIRAMCTDAAQKGVPVSRELGLLDSKLKKKKVFRVFLDFDELKKIESLADIPEYLDNARDWLIISCYTGQRVSDFMRFDHYKIRRERGRAFIDIKQVKTEKDVSIPLLATVEKVLDKRNGKFPRSISDQKYNVYIKEVCKLAGIDRKMEGKIPAEVKGIGYRKTNGVFPKWKLISSHVGRRSFATNFYGKVPTSFLKDITGHGTESMLLRYIGKTSKDTAFEAYDLLRGAEKD